MAFGEKPGALEGLRQRLYGDGPGTLSIESLRDVWEEDERLGFRQSGVFEHEWGRIDEIAEDPTEHDLPEGDFEEAGPEGESEEQPVAEEAAQAYSDKAARRAQMSDQYQKMSQERGK